MHKHTLTYSVTHTLSDGWPYASASLGLKKGYVKCRLEQEWLSEGTTASAWSAVPLWDSPLSIPLGLHFNGSCQKRESQSVKQQAKASSPENHMCLRIHISKLAK